MGALTRIHPLPPARPLPPPCTRGQTASIPPHQFLSGCWTELWGTSGSALAPMPRGVCDGLRLPCGGALAHWPLLDSNRMGAHTAMCAWGVQVQLSILLLLLLFTSATEGVETFRRLGVGLSLRLPSFMVFFFLKKRRSQRAFFFFSQSTASLIVAKSHRFTFADTYCLQKWSRPSVFVNPPFPKTKKVNNSAQLF